MSTIVVGIGVIVVSIVFVVDVCVQDDGGERRLDEEDPSGALGEEEGVVGGSAEGVEGGRGGGLRGDEVEGGDGSLF